MNIHQLDLNSDSFSRSIVKFGEPEVNMVKIPPFCRRNLNIINRKKTPIFETKATFSFLMPPGVLYLKISYTFLVCEKWILNGENRCLPQLLPSNANHMIGWDIKMTSHLNSNASFINIWDLYIIWRDHQNWRLHPTAKTFPTGTQRNNVIMTSKQRPNVILTS